MVNSEFHPVTGLAHVGILVTDLEEALRVFGDILGLRTRGPETYREFGVQVLWAECEGVRLELLRPLEGSRLYKEMATRGPGMHHVALEVDNLKGVLSSLRRCGLQVRDGPRPGLDGVTIAFLEPATTAGTLIELIQRARTPRGRFRGTHRSRKS